MPSCFPTLVSAANSNRQICLCRMKPHVHTSIGKQIWPGQSQLIRWLESEIQIPFHSCQVEILQIHMFRFHHQSQIEIQIQIQFSILQDQNLVEDAIHTPWSIPSPCPRAEVLFAEPEPRKGEEDWRLLEERSHCYNKRGLVTSQVIVTSH